MTGRITHLAALAALPGIVLLTGCKSVSKADYDEALAENAELRDRLVDTQDLLEQSEKDKAELYDENRDLASQLSEARSQAQAVPAGTSDQQPSMMMGSGGDVVLTVAGDVLFDQARVTLKSAGRRELDRIARLIMTQYASNTVRVEGYTDTDPIRKSHWKTNERLSSERALAVEQYLVSRGVDADRIYSAAMGPANPKSSKAESRRVEIVILDR